MITYELRLVRGQSLRAEQTQSVVILTLQTWRDKYKIALIEQQPKDMT